MKERDGFITVYHIIPRENGNVFWLLRMGENKPLKTFKSLKGATSYVDKYLLKHNNIKIYINDLKNHVKRYKN